MAIPRNEEEARRFVDDAVAPWRDLLIMGKSGPRALLANAITAFRAAPEWAGILRFDAFSQKTRLCGQAPWMASTVDRVWHPSDDLLATNWLQHQGIMVGPPVVSEAIETASRDFTFHPVLEYLNSLEHDGVARLDRWAIDCLGVRTTPETEPYVLAVSARFLISAVARVMQPGCKADCALILEGKQGLLKSTTLRILFQPWFADELADLGSKDAAMQLAGKWCIEMSELDSMKRGDVSRIKAFLSRSADNFRPPYGRRVIEQPRQTVIAGTVNDSEYLRDETGNRRIWPFRCRNIDIGKLAEIRDQLWAEARARYESGEVWWLHEPELIKSAHDEQDDRRIVDPWQDKIEDFIVGKKSVMPSEVLAHFGIPDKDQGQLDQNRVAACLKALGWQRKGVREDGISRRRYVAPTEKDE